MLDRKVFTLLDVTQSIEKTLSKRYSSSFWVKAEMNKLNFYNHSGHCYPDLVEKRDGKIIAQVRGVLWKNDFLRINKAFLDTLKEPLKDGVKILFLAQISFTPLYGLSLTISDIDPSYTLGDLEKEKQETIQKLKAQGIFQKNHGLDFPLLPQRIAIISVETSKGYADFLKIIENNPYNYKFFLYLFPALLQGDKAAQRISEQLKRIKKVKQHFDVVAIIRGGGGDVGLSCYNNFELASEIANFPIPVITGIGHATNETVSETVAYYNGITPSKLAQYLLQKFHDFANPLKDAERKLIDRSKQILREEKTNLFSNVKFFRSITENILNVHHNSIDHIATSLSQQSKFRFKNENDSLNYSVIAIQRESLLFLDNQKRSILQQNQKLDLGSHYKMKEHTLELLSIEKNVENMDPRNVLKRGFSITLHNGKAVQDLSKIEVGDELQTLTFEGEINSTVQWKNKTKI